MVKTSECFVIQQHNARCVYTSRHSSVRWSIGAENNVCTVIISPSVLLVKFSWSKSRHPEANHDVIEYKNCGLFLALDKQKLRVTLFLFSDRNELFEILIQFRVSRYFSPRKERNFVLEIAAVNGTPTPFWIFLSLSFSPCCSDLFCGVTAFEL